MLLGTVLVFTAHSIDGNFLINEIEALGGGTAVMGYVAAFTAIVEVPVMMFSSRLPSRKAPCRRTKTSCSRSP